MLCGSLLIRLEGQCHARGTASGLGLRTGWVGGRGGQAAVHCDPAFGRAGAGAGTGRGSFSVAQARGTCPLPSSRPVQAGSGG